MTEGNLRALQFSQPGPARAALLLSSPRLARRRAVVIVITEILGHSDIRTTKRYSHAMDETMRAAVEKLAEACAAHQTLVKRRSNVSKKKNGKLAGLP